MTDGHTITPAGLTITRTFAAARERVFEAWVRPEHFSVWFGGDSVEVPLERVSLDARVGGRWEAVMLLPDGGEIHWHGEYTEVEPPARLALTMNDEPGMASAEPLIVEFVEVEGGTRMTLTQPSEGMSEDQMEQTVGGYGGFFDVMERLLAGG